MGLGGLRYRLEVPGSPRCRGPHNEDSSVFENLAPPVELRSGYEKSPKKTYQMWRFRSDYSKHRRLLWGMPYCELCRNERWNTTSRSRGLEKRCTIQGPFLTRKPLEEQMHVCVYTYTDLYTYVYIYIYIYIHIFT